MPNRAKQQIQEQLQSTHFPRTVPRAETLSDPIADTAIVVTLDELRAYELNPRIIRNPLYDQIKASIRERGLDAPPPITRRPTEKHYIIRNGGNTRLAILNELYTETQDEHFFRIQCLFRPWSSEIMALTGHLAEDELHGSLTFIEKALGVQKAQELYEHETHKAISQSELARRLTADGYPVQQSHISRMRDAIQYLLPAIPQLLYNGLGRKQVERLVILRKSGLSFWDEQKQHQPLNPAIDFQTLFHNTLSAFEQQAASFSIERVQDELIGQIADSLNMHYDLVALALNDLTSGQAMMLKPTPSKPQEITPEQSLDRHTETMRSDTTNSPSQPETDESIAKDKLANPGTDNQSIEKTENTTQKLEAIKQLIANHEQPTTYSDKDLMLPLSDIENHETRSLYPITDIWHIEPTLDTPAALRSHIAQFAREIAAEVGASHAIEHCHSGLGFRCLPQPDQAVLELLTLLCHENHQLTPLLQQPDKAGLSDAGVIKFFRIIRLSRHLLNNH